jgi:hypothetical protein
MKYNFLINVKSPNKPTNPPEKIKKISSTYPNNIQSPFYDPTGKPLIPLAKLILKRHMTRGLQCPNGVLEDGPEKHIDQKDFDMFDLSNMIRRNQIFASDPSNISKKSRSKLKEMKLIGNIT